MRDSPQSKIHKNALPDNLIYNVTCGAQCNKYVLLICFLYEEAVLKFRSEKNVFLLTNISIFRLACLLLRSSERNQSLQKALSTYAFISFPLR